ncbi:MAG: hypothetical protein ACU0DT_00810 [Albimonas sp.]|uniref:hypothetical protein n=1 Tax=Albimonas sp. TaxID=1872425 RepID=UPI0040564BDE|tara:strand:- start:1910 stop:2143 length:234 start_codon:yes stop_codon:yes gene_type:complete
MTPDLERYRRLGHDADPAAQYTDAQLRALWDVVETLAAHLFEAGCPQDFGAADAAFVPARGATAVDCSEPQSSEETP